MFPFKLKPNTNSLCLWWSSTNPYSIPVSNSLFQSNWSLKFNENPNFQETLICILWLSPNRILLCSLYPIGSQQDWEVALFPIAIENSVYVYRNIEGFEPVVLIVRDDYSSCEVKTTCTSIWATCNSSPWGNWAPLKCASKTPQIKKSMYGVSAIGKR